MKNSEWAPGVYEQFMESYDYVTCIRGDGSYYGNGGTKCHKGTQATKKDLAAEKKKAKAGDKEAAKKVAKMEKHGVSGSAPKAKAAPAPKKAKAAPAAKKDSEGPLSKEEGSKLIVQKRKELIKAVQNKDYDKADALRKEMTKISKRMETPAEKEIEQRQKDMKKRAAKRPGKVEVSAEAKKALLTYARNEPDPPAYKSMNGCARGKRCSKVAQKDIEKLDKALNEWPANTAGASHYRGFNAKGDRLAQYANLKPGDKISDGGFGSYSRNPEIANNFSSGKGTRVIVESRSKALRGIERNATYKSEQEAILPRNTSQTVAEVRQVGDYLYVVVE